MGLISWIKRLAGVSKDRKLNCAECKSSFFFEEGEQKFFTERGLSEPKRCPTCRKQTRRNRGPRRR
ncbi:MAG: zinc-ribbon domain containing protein [Elusimicrobia bacterium]|nr:zinc-ribbon domain containing protein [Elusimicrobiota bacterium]